jgi:hypothetical protein
MFSQMQLTIKKIGQDDYSVLSGNRGAGRIMRKPKAFGESVWLWTVTGPFVPAPLLPSHGEAGSLESAKRAFREKWERLHEWSASAGKLLHWHGDLPT